ncbi:MAG: hypothetical protein Q4E13_14100, partial [Clostridia bacterium]|nr:hypothetical protein [Clostridia bacterium]
MEQIGAPALRSMDAPEINISHPALPIQRRRRNRPLSFISCTAPSMAIRPWAQVSPPCGQPMD